MEQTGVVDGSVTADGCPVEVYAALPTLGEPEWIDAVVPDGATILDLGAGVGRIADPLAAHHRVVAVDDSRQMLAHVRHADVVQSRIESLDLDERFGVVLLASHLVNTPDEEQRAAFLATVRRHLSSDGLALVEWHRPEWFDGLRPGSYPPGQLGAVSSGLEVAAYDGSLLTATVSYELRGRRWLQPFRARRLTEDELDEELAHSGLRRVAVDPPRLDWFAAAVADR